MPHNVDGRTALSISEACECSHLSSNYIGLLLRQGQLEGFKVGFIWVVFEDSLQSFLKKPRKPGPKGPRISQKLVE
jgi:hypothetical protein